AVAVRRRQQRLLNRGGDLQLLLELRFVERFAVEPRVLDCQRRFGRQRLERRLRRRRPQRAALAAVEVQHANELLGDFLLDALDVPDQPQRRAEHVADAERDGAGVLRGEIAVEEIFDDRLLPRREHRLGNLAARLERPSRQRYLAARARQLELELLLAVGEHAEAALGAGDVDRRVEHGRGTFAEHASRPERAQPFEQRRHLSQLGRRRNRAALDRRRFAVDEEHDLGVARLSEANLIAVREHFLARPVAVDVRAEARLLVADHVPAVLGRNLGMHARDVGAGQAQIGLAAPADREQRLVDRDDASAERVGDHQTRRGSVGHEGRIIAVLECLVPRFKLTIEYAGTRYSGWQIQKNARTIQGEIDRAVRTVTGRSDFELYGSGRTDAGVHALAQVAHLDVSTNVPAEQLRRRINDELPADINILAADRVPHRFHA